MLNVPKQSISISAVDLSKVSASYMRSEIAVGQWLRIVDTVFGVEFRAMVHAVEFDPTRPADIKVEIGNALVGRTEWADPDGNKAAPGTPNRDSNKAESKDVLDYIADALERGLDADRIDPGFDHSLRESMYDPPAFDAVPFADLGILADSDFTDPTGDFNPENPDSIFSPENADGPLSPFNHDSYMSPDNPLSPLSPQYPGGALNPSTPGSPLGSVYGKFKPFLTA
jgi:hypothetical protein